MPVESYESLLRRMTDHIKDFCHRHPEFVGNSDTPEYKAGLRDLHVRMVHNDNLFK